MRSRVLVLVLVILTALVVASAQTQDSRFRYTQAVTAQGTTIFIPGATYVIHDQICTSPYCHDAWRMRVLVVALNSLGQTVVTGEYLPTDGSAPDTWYLRGAVLAFVVGQDTPWQPES